MKLFRFNTFVKSANKHDKRTSAILLAVIAGCSVCSRPFAQVSLHQQTAKTVHGPKLNVSENKKENIPYPFRSVKFYKVLIRRFSNNTKSVVITVDMKVYWELRTPYSDKQWLKNRSADDWRKYVRERLNRPKRRMRRKR